MLLTRMRTVRAVGQAAVAPRDTTSRLPFRVSWLDCDLNLHMNNARYIQFMDVGRWDLMVRSGSWRLHRHVKSVVVEEKINFRRELKPGQGFTLDTRMVGFRGKAIVTEQHFLRGDTVHAKAEVVSLLLHRGKVIAAPEVRGMEDFFATPIDP